MRSGGGAGSRPGRSIEKNRQFLATPAEVLYCFSEMSTSLLALFDDGARRGSDETAVPRGPHAEEPRGSVASRSIFKFAATLASMGAFFEAASRRLEARGGWEYRNDLGVPAASIEITQNGLRNGAQRVAVAGRKKLRKGALKPLKSLGRVNSCAGRVLADRGLGKAIERAKADSGAAGRRGRIKLRRAPPVIRRDLIGRRQGGLGAEPRG